MIVTLERRTLGVFGQIVVGNNTEQRTQHIFGSPSADSASPITVGNSPRPVSRSSSITRLCGWSDVTGRPTPDIKARFRRNYTEWAKGTLRAARDLAQPQTHSEQLDSDPRDTDGDETEADRLGRVDHGEDADTDQPKSAGEMDDSRVCWHLRVIERVDDDDGPREGRHRRY